ncbi:MAG: ketohydroxyglutarate aldolase [Okeania sp. SIO2F4]|uniref:hypothetical protein n=1 Tax=Okeania sp. SIO2F4 TaxID=2607790 RepID=UPI001428D9A1|nr:hypothetical protein [Okeania sp. SIO2F4]NES06242.1 ketohydroxyglutarate aldolase [Okeania sp. SIO2F4]
MASRNVLISIHDSYLNQMTQLAEKLQAIGMKNLQLMQTVGVITGSIDESQVANISNLEGIVNWEFSQDIQISPPDSLVQ